jgi:hypothetical protein
MRGKIKHGHARDGHISVEYTSWKNAKHRCCISTHPAYDDYGGRGIKMCLRWMDSFASFIEDMGKCPDGFWLERVNNDGDYCPGNCIWTTPRKQSWNRRNGHLVTFQGKTKCISAWAYELGMPQCRLRDRILKLGWSIEKAITQPVELNPNRWIQHQVQTG